VNLKPYILILSLLQSILPLAAAAGEHKNRNGFTLDEAVQEIRAQTGGRILSAKTTHSNGKRIHQIRVLTKDGRVRHFQLKANQKRKQPPPKRRH